ncbi:hypothetical protein IMZ48_17245 [Candidatus Bathyarchaeota archaeon]|nr:hypothetical protein [Candidatus Bathyarchaeota archaeon]
MCRGAIRIGGVASRIDSRIGNRACLGIVLVGFAALVPEKLWDIAGGGTVLQHRSEGSIVGMYEVENEGEVGKRCRGRPWPAWGGRGRDRVIWWDQDQMYFGQVWGGESIEPRRLRLGVFRRVGTWRRLMHP